MYIIFQGLAPMFWGTLADSFGRRPIFIACLVLLAVSCVGLALVPTNAYWLLMVLRCVQAAGSASTIALGAGVIGDISEPAERGGFFGLYNIGPMAGPSLGPVIGGLLAGSLGWRSIFWFLVITSSGCAVVLLLLLPETLRSIVGNGSIPPSNPLFSRPVLPLLGSPKSRLDSAGKALSRKPFENPLKILSNLDILFLLLFTGIICAVFYGVTASISTIFKETHTDLTETQLGLCYLSIGGGMLIGSVTAGRLLDWDYRRVQNAELGDVEKLSRDMDSFPVEKARMRLMPVLLCGVIVSCACYGWVIERKVHIAAPLIFAFGVGFFFMAIANGTQTLIIDLLPGQGSSVTACNNLIRCSLSAAMVAAIEPIINSMGIGWAYILLAGICAASAPLIYIVRKVGPQWRVRRRQLAHFESL
ncbi:unnamed protein product [Mycena citricolor]|uniref:Major facilitator superfamily (MFS) profile domain-containing protein n=1 Tax=Mycena citricolor TaxID=2018698 RepID=A0AAD2GX16_9AGAR|nr:unnamed protein product [Mycena citricolor]